MLLSGKQKTVPPIVYTLKGNIRAFTSNKDNIHADFDVSVILRCRSKGLLWCCFRALFINSSVRLPKIPSSRAINAHLIRKKAFRHFMFIWFSFSGQPDRAALLSFSSLYSYEAGRHTNRKRNYTFQVLQDAGSTK